MMAYEREDDTSQKGCYNLWNTDGTIKQAQISTHVTLALQSIGDKRKWHGEHSSPSTTNHQEGNEL